ncbi:tachykinin-3a [Paramormyrops kingsleyae]|uniref:tachykinin-3a n=1 Tax=Paramormyrops kingsleyae TaxID=1676925 RepID=UPI000CD612C0|nr:tachykinin-3-like [Paramormyrops kingsleyae]
MRSSLLLAVLSIMMSFPSCQSSCEEQEIGEPHRSELEIQKGRGLSNIPRELLKRYSDIDYDSFVGLMGRRSSGTNNSPLRKRDMHDVFVGLMGRRSSQMDESRPWRQEYPVRRVGIFFNKCKLRSRQEE